ncbi:DUF2280 domain-containing protein [Gemmatimonadota bacterium]
MNDTGQNKTPEHVKPEICRRLACFETPSDTQSWLRIEHGLELSLPSILYYRDSEKWQDQYHRFRAEWQTSTRERIKLANVAGRVDELGKMFAAATCELERSQEESVQHRLRAELRDILEQIREEIPGGEMTGSGSTVTIELPDFMRKGLHLPPLGKDDSTM